MITKKLSVILALLAAWPAAAQIVNSPALIPGTGQVTSAQGNGAKVQLSTGTTTTNDCVKYDANGNAVDAGSACGSGGAVSVTAATPDIVITPTPGTGTFTVGSTVAANQVSTASYTVVSGDNAKTVERTYTAGAMTDTLPNTATSGFGAGFAFTLCSGPNATAQIDTVTLTAPSKINFGGALLASFALPANTCIGIADVDGTNYVGIGSAPALAVNHIYVGQTGSVAADVALAGDCTIVAAGTITCTKTSNVSFGTAATVNTGTSGATIPLLNGNNTFSGTTTLNNTVSGTGVTSVFASPPAIGGTTAAAGTFSAITDTALAGGGTQCAQVDNSGNLGATGSGCGGTTPGGGTFNFSETGLTVTAGTRYASIGGASFSSTETDVQVKSPAAITAANLRVHLSADPGMGQTMVVTLRDAAADKTVTCTITGTGGGAATDCSDTTHSFNITQNDLIDWKVVTTGTYVATPTVNITASNGTSSVGVTAVSAGSSAITVANGTTTPAVDCATSAAGQFGCAKPDGTTVTAAAGVYTAANTTINSAACTPGGSCSVNFIIMGASGTSTANSTHYFQPSGDVGAQTTDISSTQMVSPCTCTLSNLYVNVGAAPAGVQTNTYTLRANSSNTAVTCVITGAATACNDTTHTGSVTAGQVLNFKAVGSATAAAPVTTMWGFNLHQ